MADIRVLATDLEFPEGPVVMPDGSVVLVEIRGQRLTRVYPDGRKEVVAPIPGGPNGAAIGRHQPCCAEEENHPEKSDKSMHVLSFRGTSVPRNPYSLCAPIT